MRLFLSCIWVSAAPPAPHTYKDTNNSLPSLCGSFDQIQRVLGECILMIKTLRRPDECYVILIKLVAFIDLFIQFICL